MRLLLRWRRLRRRLRFLNSKTARDCLFSWGQSRFSYRGQVIIAADLTFVRRQKRFVIQPVMPLRGGGLKQRLETFLAPASPAGMGFGTAGFLAHHPFSFANLWQDRQRWLPLPSETNMALASDLSMQKCPRQRRHLHPIGRTAAVS